MAETSKSFYVLLALSRGPLHGLGIADDVAEFTDGEVLLGPGTLYRCLKELTEAGSIERVDVDDPDGTAHRKHYQLTPSGATEARRTLAGIGRLAAVGRARFGVPDLQGA